MSGGVLFSPSPTVVGLDAVVGGVRPARNAVHRDAVRNGVLAVDYADAPLLTSNCTTAIVDLPASENGCAARKPLQSARRLTCTGASGPLVGYQTGSGAKVIGADTVQLWMYFDDRSAWPDAPNVQIYISSAWAGGPSGDIVSVTRQVPRHPGWQCVEVKKSDFAQAAGVAASAWASPNYVRVHFSAGAVGASVIFDQLRWAVAGKPLVAFSLDNSYENQFAAAEILSRYGLVGNFSAVPARFGSVTDSKTRMSAAHMRDLIAMGHRPIQHTYNTVSALGGVEGWKAQVISDTKAWQDLGIDADIDCMLYLQGDYTSSTYDRALADWTQAQGFAAACASSGGGFVGSAGYRRWQLPRYEMQGPTLNGATVLSDLDAIVSKGGAVITKTHHTISSPVNADDTSIATFDAICSGVADRVKAGAIVNCTLRELALRRA